MSNSDYKIGASVLNDILTDLENKLKSCGVMYRIFGRCKTIDSLRKKLRLKEDQYFPKGPKRVQDIIGIRIVFYFASDIRPFCDSMMAEQNYCEISDSEKEFKEKCNACNSCPSNPGISFNELFGPQRLNLIFRMSDEQTSNFKMDLGIFGDELTDRVDNTYEIQLRSVLSEGWHEVEHDLRYKCKSEWSDFDDESRALNGIYAALESHEYAMELLFERMAYANYKQAKWEQMLKNHFRLRLEGSHLSEDIKRYFDENKRLAKRIFQTDRDSVIKLIYRGETCGIWTDYNNLIFMINRSFNDSKDPHLAALEPRVISRKLDQLFK